MELTHSQVTPRISAKLSPAARRLVKEQATKAQKIAQVVVSLCSEHHAVFIGCQHQHCLNYCLRQGTEATLTFGNAPYRSMSSVCGISTFNLCSTAVNSGRVPSLVRA